jgi:predicted AAA+ superfamily ATPase
MLLRAHNEASRLFDDIAYWSPAAARQTEVDFLLRRGKEYLAIEVKSQKRYSASLLSGLRSIGDLPGVVRRILVYTGDRDLSAEGIEIWPVETFIRALDDEALWP